MEGKLTVKAIDRRKAIALGAGFLAAAATAPRSAFAAPATLRVLRAAVEFSEGVQYALELGLFKKYGLDVAIRVVNSGEVAAAAIVGGSAEIGAANVLSLAVARENGVDFAFIAPGSEYVSSAPTSALIVAKSSPLRSAKDLAGKTIAVIALGDVNSIAAQAWLKREGVDPTSVRFVEIPNPQMAAAVERGVVDGAMISSPALTPALQTGRILALPYDAIGDRFLVNAWYAKRDWALAHRDEVQRFARAVAEAQQWAAAHPAASAKLLVADLKLDPELVAKMTRANFAPRLTPALIQPVIDLGARYGKIHKAFPAEALLI
jgi:NitT/TauT family transport system substrate-binding protein